MAGTGVSHKPVVTRQSLTRKIGPVLMTVGPWKPVLLHSYATRIADLDIRTTVNPDTSAALNVKVETSPRASGTVSVQLKGQGQPAKVDLDDEGVVRSKLEFAAKSVELWYPVGYGSQKLYEVEVVVHDEVSAHTVTPPKTWS
jgi:beta-mannosidase